MGFCGLRNRPRPHKPPAPGRHPRPGNWTAIASAGQERREKTKAPGKEGRSFSCLGKGQRDDRSGRGTQRARAGRCFSGPASGRQRRGRKRARRDHERRQDACFARNAKTPGRADASGHTPSDAPSKSPRAVARPSMAEPCACRVDRSCRGVRFVPCVVACPSMLC